MEPQLILPSYKPTSIVTVTLNPAIDQTVSVVDFRPYAVNRVAQERSDPGGKGVNISSFLADFSYHSVATGLLGRDNAKTFEELFAAKGIGDRFVRIDGKTRVNLKIMDEVQQDVTDLNFPGQPPTLADLDDLQEEIDQLVVDHDWFILAGSAPEGVPATVYHDLVTGLKLIDKTVVLDTSGQPLQYALAAQPDVIKPNIFELQEVLGQTLDSERAVLKAARDIVQQGIGCVVVSMGSFGALFVDAERAIHAAPPALDIKSTVGAGDAMVAGFVAAKIQGLPLDGCARLSTAFSMGALGQIGPMLPSVEAVMAFGDRVTLREVD